MLSQASQQPRSRATALEERPGGAFAWKREIQRQTEKNNCLSLFNGSPKNSKTKQKHLQQKLAIKQHRPFFKENKLAHLFEQTHHHLAFQSHQHWSLRLGDSILWLGFCCLVGGWLLWRAWVEGLAVWTSG